MNNFYSNKANAFIKLVILLTILITQVNHIKTQNATTCFEMFSNKTIQQNCINTTACCYLEYSFYNNSYVKCIEKVRNDEDFCNGIYDITAKEGSSLAYCNCFASFLGLNKIFFLMTMMNLIS